MEPISHEYPEIHDFHLVSPKEEKGYKDIRDAYPLTSCLCMKP